MVQNKCKDGKGAITKENSTITNGISLLRIEQFCWSKVLLPAWYAVVDKSF